MSLYKFYPLAFLPSENYQTCSLVATNRLTVPVGWASCGQCLMLCDSEMCIESFVTGISTLEYLYFDSSYISEAYSLRKCFPFNAEPFEFPGRSLTRNSGCSRYTVSFVWFTFLSAVCLTIGL